MRTVALCLGLLATACVRNVVVENRAPTAVAGPDQSVFGGYGVTLDGVGSSDPEGDPLSFAWNQTAGQRVSLSDGGPGVAHFEAPEVGKATTLVFQLEVWDGKLKNKASTSVTLNVHDPKNNRPVAQITAPDTAESGAMVELDGSSSKDADGDSITYAWSQRGPAPGGPQTALNNRDQPRALFVAPLVTADTVHTFRLVVSDRKGGRAHVDRSITVRAMTSNRPPLASAGWNLDAASGAGVQLSGSASDPDGDAIATWQWQQTAGPNVTLSSTTTAQPKFTAPTAAAPVTLGFSLVATDARGQQSAPAKVSVFVSPGTISKVQFTKVVSLHAVTRSSIVVFFLTDVPVAASVDFGDHSVTETQPGTRHAITLDGLTADTSYRYVVRAGTASSTGSFTTAIDYARAPRPFSFAVVGDARAHEIWKTVAASVLVKNPRFIIQTGDNNDSWGSAENWANYYATAQELFANVPVFAAQGNHDTGSNYSVYNLAPQSSSSSDLYYAFVYGNAGFVAINTNGSSRTMTSWVAQALGTLSGGPLFAFQHHPLYSCGSHGSSTSLQRTYQALFERSRVTTNYTGHDHALIVWKPIRGVRYVVSGGGGAGLYSLRGCEGPYAQSKYGFMMVDVDGATITETLYDQHGVQLYRSGPFRAQGPAPDFSRLGDLVVY